VGRVATDEELERARQAARLAEAEAGRLRGEIVELKTQLARARQDQEAYQRVLDTKRSVATEVDQWYREARGWLGRQRRKLR
jgi:hypothetical protein